jgi:hypothetical protein
VNVEELIGEVRQRLPMEIGDVLRYVTAKTGRKCLVSPDLEAEEKEHWIQVGENIYVLVNHDLEEFEVFCYDGAQEKSVKIPIASIIYVLVADKDIDKSKLYVVDLGVVEGE